MAHHSPGAPAMTLRTTRPAPALPAPALPALARAVPALPAWTLAAWVLPAGALPILALLALAAPVAAQAGACYATPADYDAVQAGMPLADVQKIMQCPPIGTLPATADAAPGAPDAAPGARPPTTLLYRARNSTDVSLRFENGRLAGKDGRPRL